MRCERKESQKCDHTRKKSCFSVSIGALALCLHMMANVNWGNKLNWDPGKVDFLILMPPRHGKVKRGGV